MGKKIISVRCCITPGVPPSVGYPTVTFEWEQAGAVRTKDVLVAVRPAGRTARSIVEIAFRQFVQEAMWDPASSNLVYRPEPQSINSSVAATAPTP